MTEALSGKQKERFDQERHQGGRAVNVLTALADSDEAIQGTENLQLALSAITHAGDSHGSSDLWS